jgi:hypothetical protein
VHDRAARTPEAPTTHRVAAKITAMSDDDLRRLKAMAQEYGAVLGFHLHADGRRVPVALFIFAEEGSDAVTMVVQEGDEPSGRYVFPRALLRQRAAEPMPPPD